MEEKPITPHAMTKKELAALYGISPKVFAHWLKKHIQEIGQPTGYYFNPGQVKKIFERFDTP